MDAPQFLYLTTMGRVSGQPREIEIWFTEREGRHYVIAEYETSNWVRNVGANAKVRWRVGDKEYAGTARVVDKEPLRAQVQDLSREKYGWGEGVVVELAPDTKH